jgi:uncharacterized Zn finger protein (UPF0148 family)
MPDLKFSCPKCQQPVLLDESHHGIQVACPTCGNTVGTPPAPANSPDDARMMATREEADGLFFEVREIANADERAAFLEAACRHSSELRDQVHRLLADEQQAESLFATTNREGGEAAKTLVSQSAATEGIGTQIGRYRLLEKIGEGGFGSVWMAEQTEPVTRKVALKIIKEGMDMPVEVESWDKGVRAAEGDSLDLLSPDKPHQTR